MIILGSILGIILVFLSSYFLASLFKRGVLLYILSISFIIFNVEFLSLFKGINATNLSIMSLVEFLIIGFIWIKKGKPVLKINLSGFFSNFKKLLIEDKSFIILSLAFIVLISTAFILSALVPPTEADAQGYHALRALFWAKDGFISHFEVTDIRCLIMPINSELIYTYILSMFKMDYCFGLLQFFSFFVVIFSSYKIMEFYEIEFPKRIWAIFMFSSFAGVISQISSTQTDLTVGALLSSSMYFILNYKKEKKISDLIFSSLAMGIAFGVKTTALMASIPLLIYFIFVLRKDFIKFFSFLVLNFMIFSSYNYILNFIDYLNPFGNQSAILAHKFWGGYKAVIGNFIRYIFQFFDFSGLNLAFYLKDYILHLENNVLSFLNIPLELGVNIKRGYIPIKMSEHIVGFGILGLLVFLPALAVSLFKKNLRIFSIIFISELLVLSSTMAYMIYSIRFITTFIVLSIPILSITYFKKMNLYKLIIIIYAVFYMGYSSLFLSERPFLELYKKKKTASISQIQEKLRDIIYFMPEKYNEAYLMKNAILPLCKDNNKIGAFANAGFRFYAAKYLDLSNDCTIYLLNPLRSEFSNNLDYIISPSNFPQRTEVFSDRELEKSFPDNIKCFYYKKEKTDDYKKIYNFTCFIKDEFYTKKGYEKDGKIEIMISPLKAKTKKREKENYTIWRKKRG